MQQNSALSALRIGIIAALCGAYTSVFFSWAVLLGVPVRFRISEGSCRLLPFTADAIPGLTLGCVVLNLAIWSFFEELWDQT